MVEKIILSIVDIFPKMVKGNYVLVERLVWPKKGVSSVKGSNNDSAVGEKTCFNKSQV
jgi:hypothetical protein